MVNKDEVEQLEDREETESFQVELLKNLKDSGLELRLRNIIQQQLRTNLRNKSWIFSNLLAIILVGGIIFCIVYLAYYYTKEPTEPIIEWEIVALSIIFFVSMILNITVLETINNAIKSGLFPKKIKQKYQLKRLFHVLGILFVILLLLQSFVNITPIEEISTVLMFIFATNIIQFNIYKSLTSVKDEKVILMDIFDLITEFSWAISDENVKKYLEKEIYRNCFLKDIEKFFKRLAGMIKYYIYPDIKIDISKSDAYLFHLSLISKENELKMQFVKSINTLRTRKYYDFFADFHRFFQMLRSKSNPAFEKQVVFKIKVNPFKNILSIILKILSNPIISPIISGIVLAIIIAVL